MAIKSTRRKIKYQATECFKDLERAQWHLTQLGALADEQSPYISKILPGLIASLEMLIQAVSDFEEGL